MEERNLYKFGAVTGIIGALIGVVANVMHPRSTVFGEQYARAFTQEIAASSNWLAIHIALLFAILFISIGFIAFSRSMRDAGGIQHLAMSGAVVGAAVSFLTLGIDGYASKKIADAWALAPDDATFAAVAAVSGVGWGGFMIVIFSLLGAAVLFGGLAVLFGATYPRWFGWAGVIVGLANLYLAAWGIYSGPTSAWTSAYLALSSIASLWALVAAGLLWRHAQQTAVAGARV